MLLKRGTGSGDETSEGENGKWEHNRENEVPDTGAIFQARFCSNFSFFPFLVLVPCSQFPVLVIIIISNNIHCFYCAF